MSIDRILKRNARKVAQLKPDQSICDVLAKLEFEDVGALVVSRSGRKILGIVSERDIVRGLRYYGAGVLELTVADLMTPNVITCEPHDSIRDAASLMRDNAVRHLPVVENGRVVGIVSIRDLFADEIGESDTQNRDGSLQPGANRERRVIN